MSDTKNTTTQKDAEGVSSSALLALYPLKCGICGVVDLSKVRIPGKRSKHEVAVNELDCCEKALCEFCIDLYQECPFCMS